MGKLHLLTAASAMALASCATGGPNISPEQCAAADWYQVGVEHGKVGANITEINAVTSACATTANPVDIDSYKLGRTVGLKSYCTPLTVLDAAAQGTGDPFQCDPMTETLRASINKGTETRQAVARYQQFKQQYDAAVQQRNQAIEQRNQINQEGAQLQQTLPQASETTNPTRTQIQQRLNYLSQALNETNQQIAQVDQQLQQANPVMQQEEQTYQAAVQSYNTYKSSLGGGG